jgi:uncharacterized protein YdhG (YjbR/CyaY superfamily)
MTTIEEYNSALTGDQAAIAERLRAEIDAKLPQATSKLWHGAPVWFIGKNPVVGYSTKKVGMYLLFWNGINFGEEQLSKVGNFCAAEKRYASVDEINSDDLHRWLKLSSELVWDSVAFMRERRAKKN